MLGRLLYGIEVLTNLSKDDLKKLSQADLKYLKTVLGIDQHTADCLVLLELGLEPLEVKVMKRRAMWLKYILDHKGELCYQILIEQIKNPRKGDWWGDASNDLKMLDIRIDIDVIEGLSKIKFKELVNEKVNKLSLKILNKQKSKLKSKGAKVLIQELKMKKYLCPESRLTQEEIKTTFQIRTDMVEILISSL